MKLVKQEHVMEEDLGEAHNLINVEFKFIFATEVKDTENQEIYKFMRQIMGDAINSNIKVNVVENETISSVVENVEKKQPKKQLTKKQPVAKEEEVVSDEFLPLSVSEQIVYDYIQKPAPEGKTFDIVWRWPAVKPVPEEVATFINCKTHGEERIVRYSYTTRINPSDKHNFWISHAKKINGDFCEEDLEVDKLVELFDAIS
jgi:hypothetical protein|tara:strand:- start:1585 stop:2190 length:606 start_codon:yes stop_codon:yes gene_type:complete